MRDSSILHGKKRLALENLELNKVFHNYNYVYIYSLSYV